MALQSDEVGALFHSVSNRRVDYIARSLTSLYVAAAMFALGALGSIAGAVLAEIRSTRILSVPVGGAAIVGIAGFVAFATGAISLVFGARITARMTAREAQLTLGRAEHARKCPLGQPCAGGSSGSRPSRALNRAMTLASNESAGCGGFRHHMAAASAVPVEADCPLRPKADIRRYAAMRLK